MKVERYDGSLEKTVLTGMIVDKHVLGAIAAKWDSKTEMFSNRWSNLVASWCVQHHKKYGKAPNKMIGGYFDRWAETVRDEDTSQLVGKFLQSISDEYGRNGDGPTPDWVLDQARMYFDRTRLLKIGEEVAAHVRAGDLDKAKKTHDSFREVQVGVGAGVNPFVQMEVVDAAFSEHHTEDLVVYPGALGVFFKHAMTRDQFIVFEGMAKVGKSYWLMDVVWRGLKQGRRVGYIVTGDMSQGQIVQRLAARASHHPIFGDENSAVRFPTLLEAGPPLNVEYKEKLFPKNMDKELAKKALSKAGVEIGNNLMLSCHPSKTLSINGVRSLVDTWDRDNFLLDILVIDYLDLLQPVNNNKESRDDINETWTIAHRLNHELHCLLVGGTQADTGSYTSKLISRVNFSGDRRKNDHVSGMVGINQLPDEKEYGVYRLNWPFRRNLEFPEDKCVYAASCLSFSNPAVLSAW
jgi:hypothetical protein